ncbi:MAG: helix-turn-helix domain-containing protein [Rhodocyclaceae bacterium]|nr:helix-turn-helix domain-containing protein [Rhodocyclaceae bacterium]
MSNEINQKPQTELDISGEVEPEVMGVAEQPSLGSNQLAAAREAKRLAVGDVAYTLKVSNKVIEALEASDWQSLPGRTFAVGILRSYGRLLDVSVDALIAEIPGAPPVMKKHLTQTDASARKASPTGRRDGESKRQEKRMLKTGVLMIVLAIILAYAIPSGFLGEAFQSVQSLAERWVRKDVVQSPLAEPVVAPAPTESVPGAPTAEASVQAPTSPGTLELKFAAPAWVEVRDHTGRIIYSQLNAAGTTQFITGAAPLDILIGNARQVQARWRDEPLKLDKLTGDDVARQVLR